MNGLLRVTEYIGLQHFYLSIDWMLFNFGYKLVIGTLDIISLSAISYIPQDTAGHSSVRHII